VFDSLTNGHQSRKYFRDDVMHFAEFLSDFGPEDALQAQLGIGHSFSRNKII
jgi:hypothetical protein